MDRRWRLRMCCRWQSVHAAYHYRRHERILWRYWNFNITLLPDNASIFTAEPYAILLITDIMKINSNTKFALFSDSLSCLQAILNKLWDNPIIINILNSLHHLITADTDIVFIWLPSHAGILDNAKGAVRVPVIIACIDVCRILKAAHRTSECRNVPHILFAMLEVIHETPHIILVVHFLSFCSFLFIYDISFVLHKKISFQKLSISFHTITWKNQTEKSIDPSKLK